MHLEREGDLESCAAMLEADLPSGGLSNTNYRFQLAGERRGSSARGRAHVA